MRNRKRRLERNCTQGLTPFFFWGLTPIRKKWYGGGDYGGGGGQLEAVVAGGSADSYLPAFPLHARDGGAESDVGNVGGEEVDDRGVSVDASGDRALFLFTRTRALGHRAFADDAGIGGLEAADPLGGERAFTRELVSAGAFGEEVGERAIGLAVRVEESEDAVETIPIVGDANEAAAVRLQAIADHVGERQAAFAE